MKSFIGPLFSRRWLLLTLAVIAVVGLFLRLGAWQLDRRTQRLAFNARVEAQVDAPPLQLEGPELPAGLEGMEYRKVTVRGEYDFAHQVALRNQPQNGQWGVELLTPLKIAGSDQAVLVDRGWVPGDESAAASWGQYDEPGTVTVAGVIRASRPVSDFGGRTDPTLAPGQPARVSFNSINVPIIAGQMPYRLLPVYIQQAPEAGQPKLPQRSAPELELSEGPHLVYAIQWFAFALILAGGYPFFVRRQDEQAGRELAAGHK